MSYAERQSSLDACYAREYREWVASLPPEDRAELDAQGLAAPDASRRTSTRQGDELAIKLAGTPPCRPGDTPEPGPETAAARESDTAAADTIASIFARVRAHPNPLLALDAVCFATGLMGVEGLSESALAERHHVTRAAFSKLAVQFRETFDLPPTRGMRSKRVRRNCREARLNYLARKDDRISA